MGYGKAVELAMATMEERAARETQLRDYLMKRVMDEVPFTRINGSRTSRLPNNVNFAFQFIEGESLPHQTGYGGNLGIQRFRLYLRVTGPHVLLSGCPYEIAFHGSLRLTLSEENTEEEMDWWWSRLRISWDTCAACRLCMRIIRKHNGSGEK